MADRNFGDHSHARRSSNIDARDLQIERPNARIHFQTQEVQHLKKMINTHKGKIRTLWNWIQELQDQNAHLGNAQMQRSDAEVRR